MPQSLASVEDRSQVSSLSREGRAHPRHVSDVPITCQPISAWGSRDKHAGTIRDVSVGGFCLILSRRFEKGTGLAVELPGGKGEEPCVVLVKVMRVASHEEGAWLLGCKFISELSEEELQRLAPYCQSTASAAPAAAPVAPSLLATTIPSINLDDTQARCVFENVSVRLETPLGQLIKCRIKHFDVPTTWPPRSGRILTLYGDTSRGSLPALRLIVTSCAQREGRWTLECRLLTPPTAKFWSALGKSAPQV